MSVPEKSVFKIHIKGAIDRVFHEITQTDKVQECMFNNRMHTTGLKPGAPIRMRSEDGKYTGVVGDVLEFDPPRLFSHTMKFTDLDDPSVKITYILEEKDGGVDFTLIAEEIPTGTKTEKYLLRGGDMICKTLKAVVENGKPPFSTRMLYTFFKLLRPLTPKKCLSENWPLEEKAG